MVAPKTPHVPVCVSECYSVLCRVEVSSLQHKMCNTTLIVLINDGFGRTNSLVNEHFVALDNFQLDIFLLP